MVRAGSSQAGISGINDTRRALLGSVAVRAPVSPDATLLGNVGYQHIPFRDAVDLAAPLAAALPSDANSAGESICLKPWRCLCIAEIANFAALRRHLGAACADRLVLDVADRVSLNLPDARIGVVGRRAIEMFCDGDSIDTVTAALRRVQESFDDPLNLDGEPHRIELHLGAAAAPIAQADEVRMAEEAEQAVREASGEERLVVRDLSADTPAFDRLTLIRDLEGAIERGEMFLQYQPKVHLRHQEIRSVEALVRWQHPVRGLVLPGDFIQVAEDARIIGGLTLWTLDQVIADQKLLAAQGHDLTIFVNISGQLLGDPAFVARACQLVRTGGAKIGFEITETSVIRDPQTAINHLQVFAEIGIPIAIDDYGAGLSSLAYLKQLPASELKIDKMFVVQLTSSNRDPLIVRSTIDLAHALEMEVTAEGVETQAALALLSVMGCDMVQGYLISRPISFEALVQYLDEDRHLATTVNPRASFNRPETFWKQA